MNVYDRPIQTAKTLIEKYGVNCTWLETIDPTINPLMPWHSTENANIEHDVFICFVAAGGDVAKQLFQSLTKSIEVPEGMIPGLMASVEFQPSIRDSIELNGQKLKVGFLDKLAPAGFPILYTLGFEE